MWHVVQMWKWSCKAHGNGVVSVNKKKYDTFYQPFYTHIKFNSSISISLTIEMLPIYIIKLDGPEKEKQSKQREGLFQLFFLGHGLHNICLLYKILGHYWSKNRLPPRPSPSGQILFLFLIFPYFCCPLVASSSNRSKPLTVGSGAFPKHPWLHCSWNLQ